MYAIKYSFTNKYLRINFTPGNPNKVINFALEKHGTLIWNCEDLEIALQVIHQNDTEPMEKYGLYDKEGKFHHWGESMIAPKHHFNFLELDLVEIN